MLNVTDEPQRKVWMYDWTHELSSFLSFVDVADDGEDCWTMNIFETVHSFVVNMPVLCANFIRDLFTCSSVICDWRALMESAPAKIIKLFAIVVLDATNKNPQCVIQLYW